jgi:hypothetical protein
VIENSDITVVIQGPVMSLPDRKMDHGITSEAIASVRRCLPGARIILSTWQNQPTDGLDYDELLLNEDPGANRIGFNVKGEPLMLNHNRQIHSSLEGLKRVKTRYAMKLRSDNFLASDAFKHLQQAFPKRASELALMKEHVVVNNTFTRAYSKSKPAVFHMCDFFYFGLTEDVKAMWDMPFFKDYEYDHEKKNQAQYDGFPFYKTDCTQKLLLAALKKFDKSLELNHLHHYDAKLKHQSDLLYANNFIIGEPEVIGLGLCSKFSNDERANRLSGRLTFITFDDWQLLYKKYCDGNLELKDGTHMRLLKRNVLRFLMLVVKRFEDDFRYLKKRIRKT